MARETKLPKYKCTAGRFQHLRNTLILGLLLMTDPFIQATAQQFQTVLSFSRDTIPVTNTTMVALTLKIQNRTLPLQNGFVEVSADSVLELFTRERVSLLPGGDDPLYIPVRVRVPENAVSGHLYPVAATLKSPDGYKPARTVCYLKIVPTRKVILSLPESIILLHEDDPAADIPVRLTNKGNTSQTVSVIFQSSSLQQWQDIMKVSLSPFADTVIHLNKKVPRSFYNKNLQQIHINGVYSNGDPFGRVSVSTSQRTSQRNYRQSFAQEMAQSGYNGRIKVTGQYLFTSGETWNLAANGNILFNTGVLDYRLDVTHWKNKAANPLLVRNTYLEYEHSPTKKAPAPWGITAGNLSRNYEHNISGRGFSAFITDSAGVNRLEAGIAQGIYGLFSSFNAESSWRPATTFWINFKHLRNQLGWNSCFLQQRAPYEQRVSRIWSNELDFQINTTNKMTLTANAGHSTATSGVSSPRTGIAGGIVFQGNSGRLSLSSNNFFSTAYYPGMRQGALNLLQRLSYRTGKSGLAWVAFNQYQYAPEPLPGIKTGFPRHYGSTRVTTGLSFQKKNLSFSFLPEWSRETSSFYTSGFTGLPAVLRACDLSLMVSYSGFPSEHQFSVSSTAGFLTPPPISGTERFHFRSRLNWQFQSFNLMASWQSGYFYLAEMTGAMSGVPGKNYHHLYIAPQWNKQVLRKRATINLGLTWTKGTITGSNFIFHAGIRLKLGSGSEVFSNFTRYEYASHNPAENDLQTGMSSVLPPLNFSGRNHTLEILLYKDLNTNGIWDGDDQPAAQYALAVGDVLFVTNAAGLIRYRGLPAGAYGVTITPAHGWYAEKREVTIDRSKRLEIPLQQAAVLKGGITVIANGANGLIRETMTTHGLRITAESKEGKTYTAQTGEKGNFIFYLPAGIYMVRLQLSSAECLCLNNSQEVRANPEQPALIDFRITHKQKKIDIKRFTDASLQ